MLSTVTKCLTTFIDPDVYILKGLKHIATVVKGGFDSINITIAGFPLGLLTIGIGIIMIGATIIKFKYNNDEEFKAKVQGFLQSESFTKKLLVASGVITILIFSI